MAWEPTGSVDSVLGRICRANKNMTKLTNVAYSPSVSACPVDRTTVLMARTTVVIGLLNEDVLLVITTTDIVTDSK